MSRWEIFPCRMCLAPGEPDPFEPFEVEGTSAEVDRKLADLRRRYPGVTLYAAEKESA